ncbi:MAG: VWA domain-containing protein [Hyphomonadaceae bacterium]|nr:VWA domain-containing protein [Hyphomonadaceae bacterium]
MLALSVAACASQKVAEQNADEAIVTTGSRVDQPSVVPPPPPAPPPPPPMQDAMARPGRAMEGRMMMRAAPAIGGIVGGNYAQSAPQPMPGTIDRERYENVEANPVKQVATDPVSTFSVDVDTASYSNVRRFLNQGQLPPRDAVRIEELINYFDYDYRLPRERTRPFEPTVSMVPSPWAQGRTLLHIGLQGYDIVPATRPPLNLVLLLDVSGSMSSPDKLPLVIQSMRLLVDQLNARDRISIVVYAGAAGAVLEPTPGNEKARILAALEQLQAGGSTAGGAGLALAYSLAERNLNRNAVNRVILATDGDFNVGVADNERLEDFVTRKRETGIYLSVLGFGGGNYNDSLMQTLAQNGNGVAAYIDTLAEARRVLKDEMASSMFPIANDVKIQVEFNPGRVAEYRLIGYETRMLRREDFNNDRVDAGEIGSGHAVTAIYELTAPGGRTLNDPLRYQQGAQAPPAATGSEIAFLRIRYKLPGASESRLIERPITSADMSASLAAAPEQTRWATAVAGFGQLLRADPYLDRSYGWSSVIDLAQGARGSDEFGWRAEFVQLARAAQTAQAAAPPVVPSQGEPPTPRPPNRAIRVPPPPPPKSR